MKYSSQSGLSLLEILVTITILSILSSLAAPSVSALIQSNRARSVSDEFTSSLYQARSESVKRGHRITLCASDALQQNCAANVDNFSGGWIIFTDYNDNQILDPVSTLFDTSGDGVDDSPEELLFVSEKPAENIEIKTNGTPRRSFTYRSNGLVDNVGIGFSVFIRDAESAAQLSRLTINMTGRVKQCIGDAVKCP